MRSGCVALGGEKKGANLGMPALILTMFIREGGGMRASVYSTVPGP